MLRNLFFFVSVVTVCVFLGLSFFVFDAINRDPITSYESPSRGYRVDHVVVTFPFSYRQYAYIRVTDVLDPKQVYRSPILDEEGLSMRVYEDKETVGVSWLYFNKVSHTFDLGFPQWRESWLNFFISNTPYEVSANE